MVPGTARHGPPAVGGPRGSCSQDPNQQDLTTEHRDVKDVRAGDGFRRVLRGVARAVSKAHRGGGVGVPLAGLGLQGSLLVGVRPLRVHSQGSSGWI